MAEGYLPPVVVEFTGDATKLLATIAKVKTYLADLAKTVTNTQIGADIAPFETDLGSVRSQLLEFARDLTNARIGADSAPFWAGIAALRAEFSGISPLDVDVDAKVASALAKLAALREAFDLTRLDANIESQLGANEANLIAKLAAARTALAQFASQVTASKLTAETAPFWAEILALRETLSRDPATLTVDGDIKPALAKIAELRGLLAFKSIGTSGQAWSTAIVAGVTAGEKDAASKIGGVGGLLTALGFGRGRWGFAAFGTIASLMGFGLEHAITTAIGLAGSAVGALLGGGLLALGSLGVALTGFATDLAGIGQAAGDIRTVSTDLSSLNQAVALYGANSSQAAAAQAQLNYALGGFSPVARNAVLAVARMGQTIKSEFDAFTGQAEKLGAQIIGEFGTVVEAFIPTIGHFATINMGIIKSGLSGLIAWLKNPTGGLGDFTILEQQFTKTLPTAVHAFSQAVEFLIKTFAALAPYTGRFITTLDKFFTKWNTAPKFAEWTTMAGKLIGMFRTWVAFLKILVEDIALIFSHGIGLGTGIITTLTGDLTKLHAALVTTGKNSQLSQLFATHKQEVIALIQAIVGLGTAFTKMYLIAAPTMVRLATLVIRLVGAFVNLVSKFPGGADLLGFALLFARMGTLSALLVGVDAKAGILAKTFALFGKITGIQAIVAFASRWIKAFATVTAASIAGAAKSFGAWALSGLSAAAAFVARWTAAFAIVTAQSIAGAARSFAAWVSAAAGGEAATAGEAVGASFGTALAGAAALAAGYGIGTILNHYLNLSGRIASLFEHPAYSTSGIADVSSTTLSTVKSLNVELAKLQANQAGIAHWGRSLTGVVLIPPVDPAIPGLIQAIKNRIAELTPPLDAAKGSADKFGSSMNALMDAAQRLAQANKYLKDSFNPLQTAIAGLSAPMQKMLAPIRTMISSYQKLGSSIHGTAAQIVTDIQNQDTAIQKALLRQLASMANWGTDVQTLLKKGMSLQAVQYLEKYMPQELGVAASESKAQVAKMTAGIAVQLFQMKVAGAKSVGDLRTIIVNGMHSAIPAVRSAADAMARAAKIKIDLTDVGRNAAQSLAAGINSQIAAVAAAAAHLGSGAVLAARAAIAMHSPSLRFLEIGLGAGQGLTLGLKQSMASVIAASKALAQAALSAFGSLKNLQTDRAALQALNQISSTMVGLLTNLGRLPTAFAKISGAIRNVPAEFQAIVPTVERLIGEFATLLGSIGNVTKMAKLGGPLVSTLGDLAAMARDLRLIASAFTALHSSVAALGNVPDQIRRITPTVERLVAGFATLLNSVGNLTKMAKLGAALNSTLAALVTMARDLYNLATAFTALRTAVPELNRIPDQLRRLSPAIREIVQAFERVLKVLGNTSHFAKWGAALDSTLGTIVAMAQDLMGLSHAFTTLKSSIGFIDQIPRLLRAVSPAVRQIVQDFGRLLGTIGNTSGLAKLGGPLALTLSTLVAMAQDLVNLAKAFTTLAASTSAIDRIPARLRALSPAIREAVQDFAHLLGTIGSTKGINALAQSVDTTLHALLVMAQDLTAISAAFAKFGTTLSGLAGVASDVLKLGVLRTIFADLRTELKDIGSTTGLAKGLAAVASVLNTLATVFSSLASAGKAAALVVPSGITAILTALQTLNTRVLAYLRTITPEMKATAVQWMNALGAGIVSVSLIGSMRLVTNALLAYMRSLTPLFRNIGLQWMEALAQGIKAGSKLVQANLVLPKTVAVNAGTTAGVGGTGGVTMHTTIQVYAPTGNATDISRTLQKALDKRDNQLVAKIRAGSAGHLVSG